MDKAKNKFEITRNISTTSIRKNLLCSSDILKNSEYLLKHDAATANPNINDEINFSHLKGVSGISGIGGIASTTPLHMGAKFVPDSYSEDFLKAGATKEGITYKERESQLGKDLGGIEGRDSELGNEFRKGILYDKLIRSEKNYKSAADIVHRNFRDNNLTNVVSSIKFEDNLNMKIPAILKMSPVDILFPECINLKENANENKLKNDVINALTKSKDTRKEITNYLRHDLTSNTIMKNKMYDYFDLEKQNYIQIENPNTINNNLTNSKLKRVPDIILNAYKSVRTINKSDHRETEANVLNLLKQQPMPLIDKKDQENDFLNNTSANRRNMDHTHDLAAKKKEIEKNSQLDAKRNEKEFSMSFIDISNQKATIKNYNLKKNEEIKNRKNIFNKVKKNLKNAQVQTNEEDLEKSKIKIVDSDVEHVLNAFDKAVERGKEKQVLAEKFQKRKNNELANEMLSEEPKNEAKEVETETKHKVVYNCSKPLDEEKTDSETETETETETGSESNNEGERKSGESQSGTSAVDEEMKQREEIKKQILHYNYCLTHGLPHTLLNPVGKNASLPFPSMKNNIPNSNASVGMGTGSDIRTNEILKLKFLNTYKKNLAYLLNSKKYKKKSLKCFIPPTSAALAAKLSSRPLMNNTFIPPPHPILPQGTQSPHVQLDPRGIQNQFNRTDAKKMGQMNQFPFYNPFKQPRSSVANKNDLEDVDGGVDGGVEGDDEDSDSDDDDEDSDSDDDEEDSDDDNKEVKTEMQKMENGKEDVTDILLQKFYSSKKEEKYERQKFKEALWKFLINNDMLKERSRGKFNSLRNMYYAYNFTDKEDAKFLKKFREWEKHYDRNYLYKKEKNTEQVVEKWKNKTISGQKITKKQNKNEITHPKYLNDLKKKKYTNTEEGRALSQPINNMSNGNNKKDLLENEKNEMVYANKEKMKTLNFNNLTPDETKQLLSSSFPNYIKYKEQHVDADMRNNHRNGNINERLGEQHKMEETYTNNKMITGNLMKEYKKFAPKVLKSKIRAAEIPKKIKINNIRRNGNTFKKETFFDTIKEEKYTKKYRSHSYKNRAATLNSLMKETAPLKRNFQTEKFKEAIRKGERMIVSTEEESKKKAENTTNSEHSLILKKNMMLKRINKRNKKNVRTSSSESINESISKNKKKHKIKNERRRSSKSDSERTTNQIKTRIKREMEKHMNGIKDVKVVYNFKKDFSKSGSEKKERKYKRKSSTEKSQDTHSSLFEKEKREMRKQKAIEEEERHQYDDTDGNKEKDSLKSFDHFFDRRMLTPRFEKETIHGNVKREEGNIASNMWINSGESDQTDSTKKKENIRTKEIRGTEKKREAEVAEKEITETEEEKEEEEEEEKEYTKKLKVKEAYEPIRIQFNLKKIKTNRIHSFIKNDDVQKEFFEKDICSNSSEKFKEKIDNKTEQSESVREHIIDSTNKKKENTFLMNLKYEMLSAEPKAYEVNELDETKPVQNKIVKKQNFLKKHNGSGGGNYLKIKQEKYNQYVKGASPQKREIKNKTQKENIKTEKKNMSPKSETVTDIKNDTNSNLPFKPLCSSKVFSNNANKEYYEKNFKLKQIDPNKWMQDVFGDNF